MALGQDYMGLGLPHLLAARLANPPVLMTAYGTSSGSANQIAGTSYFVIANSGTSSLKLPVVGGDQNGALLGDRYVIGNITSASVAVYAANNSLGSAVTFYTTGASTAGTTGVSVGVGSLVEFLPVTISTWYVSYGSA